MWTVRIWYLKWCFSVSAFVQDDDAGEQWRLGSGRDKQHQSSESMPVFLSPDISNHWMKDTQLFSSTFMLEVLSYNNGNSTFNAGIGKTFAFQLSVFIALEYFSLAIKPTLHWSETLVNCSQNGKG